MIKMPKKTVKRPTLCWKCRNAVPTATSGCSWSRDLVPVPGWVAEKHQQKSNGSIYEAYCVTSCPLFQKDGKNSADSCKDDTGRIRIAEHILRGQMNRYRTALERYARTRSANDLAQFRSIERDLLTPYYAALTLHSIDLRQVCNELRQKAGLPELEEMQ